MAMLLGLKRNELPILIVNLIYIPIFTVVAALDVNFEFILYILVVVAVGIWILLKQRSVQFPPMILWGLTGWGLLHMAGGNIPVGDGVLYGVQLIPTVLRYDQMVHFLGFGTATLVCHHLLKPYLRDGISHWGVLSGLIVLMGSGLGAVNEIIEFIAVMICAETGVGGYENTLWDLVFNFAGGLAAVCLLAWQRRGERQNITPA